MIKDYMSTKKRLSEIDNTNLIVIKLEAVFLTVVLGILSYAILIAITN